MTGIKRNRDTRPRRERTADAPSVTPCGRPTITVLAASPADAETAAALAARLGARDVASADDERAPAWTLSVDGPRRVLARPDGARLELDFTAGRTAARQRESGLAGQPLARAVGFTRLRRRLGREPRVADATGGLGRDAWFIASLGCPVVLIERSPLVHALLEAALSNAGAAPATAPVAERIRLLHGEATACLARLDPADVDTVYLDPMYPPTKRRAAVTKGMQFLHELLGEDIDNEDLLDAALDAASAQVTVKRPSGAPPLPGNEGFGGQRSTVTSPGTRYDVYHLTRNDTDTLVEAR